MRVRFVIRVCGLVVCAGFLGGAQKSLAKAPVQAIVPAQEVEAQPPTYADLSLEGLRAEMIHIASKIHEFEARAFDIESNLVDLEVQLSQKQELLEAHQKQISSTLQSLIHLSQTSPLTLLMLEKDANQMLRSGLLLQSIWPSLKQKGDVLRQQVTELSQLRHTIERQRQALGPIYSQLVGKQGILSGLMEAKAKALATRPKVEFDEAVLSSGTVQELLGRVKGNKSLAKKFKQQVKELELAPPAPGKVLSAFDKNKEFSAYGTGVVMETREGAQLTAPTNGAVVFSGPFRGYGNILIIHAGKDYHVLLAGMEKIYVAAGQEILSGEPIAQMHKDKKRPKLYIELRKNTVIVDPTPWILKWKK
jgi:septal ring factor EnvC (AmiA/AmiB activator)